MVAVSFNVAGNRSTRLSSCYFVRFWLVTLVTIWVLVFFVRLRIFTLAAVSSFVTLVPVSSFVILFSFCFSYCCSCLSSCSFVPPPPFYLSSCTLFGFGLSYSCICLSSCSSVSYPYLYNNFCSSVRFRLVILTPIIISVLLFGFG